MAGTKVLIITNEMGPYVEETHQAEFARAIPQQMQEQGMEVRCFMPRFGGINERKHRLHEVIRLSGINVPVGEFDNPMIIKVASLPSPKMQVYFVDNEDFFHKRNRFYDNDGNFYEDNDERTIFFNKGAIEILLKLGWMPDIIHCHGWMTGLIPLYARTIYKNEPVFRQGKIVYTAYQDVIDEQLGDNFVKKTHLKRNADKVKDTLTNPRPVDIQKVGTSYADAVSEGDTQIADELKAHIGSLNKPTLGYQDPGSEAFTNSYVELYQKLLS